MAQVLHTVRGDTFEEAHREVRRRLGDAAVVVRTREVTEGGMFGFLGKRRIELVVSCPEDPARERAASPAQRKYAENARPQSQQAPGATAPEPEAGVGSNERFQQTIAHFQQRLQQAREQAAAAAPPSGPPGKDTAPAPRGAPLGTRAYDAANHATARTTGGGTLKAEGRGGPARQPGEDGPAAATARVLPFERPREHAEDDSLRRELLAMRESLDVLVAETPGAGLPPHLAPYYRDLVARGVTRKLATALLKRVEHEPPPHDARRVAEALKREIRRLVRGTGGIDLEPGARRVVALTGTTGVGKTTNLAKLAAHYALRRRARVALVTTDTYRIAAPQQLKVYADIIGLPMRVANDPDDMLSALRAFLDYDLVLIDTPGGSQFNVRYLKETQAILRAARPDETLLTLSSGAQLEDLRLTVENFRNLRPTALMFTKLDETRKFGAMLSAIVEADLPVAYFSIGQDVPADIRLAQPAGVASLVVEGKGRRGGPSTTTA
jgi:flagellar biosynthesis protein FlhF